MKVISSKDLLLFQTALPSVCPGETFTSATYKAALLPHHTGNKKHEKRGHLFCTDTCNPHKPEQANALCKQMSAALSASVAEVKLSLCKQFVQSTHPRCSSGQEQRQWHYIWRWGQSSELCEERGGPGLSLGPEQRQATLRLKVGTELRDVWKKRWTWALIGPRTETATLHLKVRTELRAVWRGRRNWAVIANPSHPTSFPCPY